MTLPRFSSISSLTTLGKKVLALPRVFNHCAVQKRGKTLLRFFNKAGRKAPQVHGHHGVARQCRPSCALILGKAGTLPFFFNMGALGHFGQVALRVRLANATGYIAIFRKGITEQVAHHGILISFFCIRVFRKILINLLKRSGP